ncbi:CsbD family protein [Microbacterium neungamense]|nr:CsbD family protein [Microbacterium neungamense]UWF77558.1 CsbD family protein [Microbacterium neungamense]
MGAMDKAKHKAEEMVGKAKEGIGDATDNESLQAEGKLDQAKANVKQAGDEVKEGVKDAFDDDK